jgi:hypothetical protein
MRAGMSPSAKTASKSSGESSTVPPRGDSAASTGPPNTPSTTSIPAAIAASTSITPTIRRAIAARSSGGRPGRLYITVCGIPAQTIGASVL